MRSCWSRWIAMQIPSAVSAVAVSDTKGAAAEFGGYRKTSNAPTNAGLQSSNERRNRGSRNIAIVLEQKLLKV
ncbi:hypothetical protein BGX38DRAFT_1208823, partial [Terfezia claveryi]